MTDVQFLWIVPLTTAIVGLFWKPTWAVFFGLGTLILLYAGHLGMLLYALAFAAECASLWSGELFTKMVRDIVTNRGSRSSAHP